MFKGKGEPREAQKELARRTPGMLPSTLEVEKLNDTESFEEGSPDACDVHSLCDYESDSLGDESNSLP